MLIRIIFMGFLGFFLSSCSMPYSAVMKKYQDASVCCKSMSQVKFETLNIGDSKSFKMNEETDVFLFDTGKSYFKAFEIPQTGYPYHFFIKSYMLGDQIRFAYIFIPYVLTLDEKYHVVRSTVPSNLCLKKAGFMETLRESGGLMSKLEGFVHFTGENKNEKYIVVLTTESLLQEKIYKTYRKVIPFIFPGIVGALPGPKDLAIIPASPMGYLNVSLVSGVSKDFVVIDHREKSFTIFSMIPEEGIDKVKAVIEGKKDIDIVTLEEFTNRAYDFITSRIIRNEYEGSQIEQVVVNFLYKHAGSPVSVTWNGGIAITNKDAEYAKTMYQLYINNPEDYERKKIQDPHADPVNPQRNLGTYFGPLFEW